MSDSDSTQPDYATDEEKYLHGLMCGSKKSRKIVEVIVVEGRGRSAFVKREFNPGELCV